MTLGNIYGFVLAWADLLMYWCSPRFWWDSLSLVSKGREIFSPIQLNSLRPYLKRTKDSEIPPTLWTTPQDKTPFWDICMQVLPKRTQDSHKGPQWITMRICLPITWKAYKGHFCYGFLVCLVVYNIVAWQVHPALVRIPSRVTQFCVTVVN